MPEILHVSDLHFGPPFLPDRAAAVRDLAEIRNPDTVVVSGDFTQRAKKSQFSAARDYLDSFDVPVVVTPGNHDVPLYRLFERLLTPHRNYRQYISDELNHVYRRDGMTVVSLNSSRRLALKNGKLRERQLDFAAEAFAESPDEDLRVVVTHHHLAPPPDFSRDGVMPGAREALRAFGRFGVHLILAGHLHRSFIGNSLDFFPQARREEAIVIVQCGTTTSARGRGRERLANSLNYIEANRDEVFITHYLWRDPERGFWPHSKHRFGIRPGIWLERSGGSPGRQADRAMAEGRDRER